MQVISTRNSFLFIWNLTLFTTNFKSFYFVIVFGTLYHTELSNKLALLSSFSYFESIDKIGKIDNI